MTKSRPFVAIVDDDESVRESLPGLLAVLGFDSMAFVSADAFLASGRLESTNCLILDIAMPGMGGPELMRQPSVRARGVPVIVITALQDDAIRQEMLSAGAADCLFKPFSETALIEAMEIAIGSGGPPKGG